jgi:hypothetical protein
MKFVKPCGHKTDQYCHCVKIEFNHAAIRALTHAFSRSERLKAQDEGAAADRQFDGGEWSDGFHADTMKVLELTIAARVASRFGMSARELMDQYVCASMDQGWRQAEACQAVLS